MLLIGCFDLVYPKEQKNSYQEEESQKYSAVSHTTGKLGHNAIHQGTYDDTYFFGDIIKTEKRSGIGGLGQKFGIGRTGQCLNASHYNTDQTCCNVKIHWGL